MRLRDIFILEGLKDRENRELAEFATQTLIDNVARVRTPHFTGKDNEDFVAVGWRGWDFPDVPDQVAHLFDDMIFFISAVPPEKQNEQYIASFYHHSELKYDSITAYFKPKGAQVTEEAWKKYATIHGPRILENLFTPIVHEFIHAMDSKRLSDPKYMDTSRYDATKLVQHDPEEIQRYADDPLEFNALFQQFTSKIEKKLASNLNVGDEEGFIPMESPRNMVAYGLKNISKDWQGHLSPEMKRHLIKRLTQFYYDMRDKYGAYG